MKSSSPAIVCPTKNCCAMVWLQEGNILQAKYFANILNFPFVEFGSEMGGTSMIQFIDYEKKGKPAY